MKGADGEDLESTRMEQIEEDGGTLEMPEQSMPYLWERLNDAGMYGQGGMGPAPLSCTELQAWSQGTGMQLAPWEFRAIRAASRAFVSQLSSKDEVPPYGDPDALADPDVVEAKLERMFDRLARPLDKR